jgi:hypothetical protein
MNRTNINRERERKLEGIEPNPISDSHPKASMGRDMDVNLIRSDMVRTVRMKRVVGCWV